ncbi:GNAT family N-acetyltransferase [Gymnodinialimonas sp. 57CJ19]|uniref:GNAT family N-acetyltransferase n=1 Tax=Gymnodinialimonas sp. 57CJ19 TaxID=3138498 RepID=UPI0031342E40
MTNFETQFNPHHGPAPEAVHDFLNTCFAPMADRIDPPSSLTSMSLTDVAQKMADEDFFCICNGVAPVACLFGHGEGTVYEVGKIAVAPNQRKQGLARVLVDTAAAHAHAKGFATLQLYARVQLVENHAIYTAMGFTRSGTFTHPGFDAPTALIFQRAL